MQGFITERDLEQADEAFPGISCFFASLGDKPTTFLELVAIFDHWTSTEFLEGAVHADCSTVAHAGVTDERPGRTRRQHQR